MLDATSLADLERVKTTFAKWEDELNGVKGKSK
jgi:hypothetical protein